MLDAEQAVPAGKSDKDVGNRQDLTRHDSNMPIAPECDVAMDC